MRKQRKVKWAMRITTLLVAALVGLLLGHTGASLWWLLPALVGSVGAMLAVGVTVECRLYGTSVRQVWRTKEKLDG